VPAAFNPTSPDPRVTADASVFGTLARGSRASLAFPFFLYGVTVNGLPYFLPRLLSRRFSRKETDYATTRFLSSVVAIPLFWSLETWLVWRLAGPGWASVTAPRKAKRVDHLRAALGHFEA